MQGLAALSMLVVGVVTLAVGARLLWLWRRTRALPELCFGLGFVSGSLGTAGAQLGQRLWWTEPGALSAVMNGACFALMVIGTIALWIVIARVFRPGHPWATGIVVAGSAAALVSFGLRWLGGDFPAANLESAGMALFHGGRIVLFSWSAIEAFLYYRLLRKRLRLGLADPVSATQILLWAIAGTVMVGLTAIIVICIFALGRHPLEIASATVLLTAGATLTSVAMWCAFFPPPALRRRLAGGRVATS